MAYAPPSRRRALIIGVNYTSSKDWFPLSGQKDASSFANFLVEHRKWEEEEIVLMLDNVENGRRKDLVPTQANIRREIRLLTADVQPGDHFVFFFAGHSSQLTNKGGSEDDGMDEVIIPCDCNGALDRAIIDNELKQLLVDPLPLGTSLTAVFDSCHSGTLLDLPHYRCNSVYVPWLSKGRRRSDTLRNSMVRELASWHAVAFRKNNNSLLPSSIARKPRSARISHSSQTSRLPSLDASTITSLQHNILPPHYPASEQTIMPNPTPTPTYSPTLPRTLSSPARLLPRPQPRPRLSTVQSMPAAHSNEFSGMSSPIRRCVSPEPIEGRECDGWCDSSSEEWPQVVSLSACADKEQAWEGSSGETMTSALLSILRETPNCSYQYLLRHLSHHLHNTSRQLHKWTRDQKRAQHAQASKVAVSVLDSQADKSVSPLDAQASAAWADPAPGEMIAEDAYEMDNFQYPQLSSHVRLNMDDEFRL